MAFNLSTATIASTESLYVAARCVSQLCTLHVKKAVGRSIDKESTGGACWAFLRLLHNRHGVQGARAPSQASVSLPRPGFFHRRRASLPGQRRIHIGQRTRTRFSHGCRRDSSDLAKVAHGALPEHARVGQGQVQPPTQQPHRPFPHTACQAPSDPPCSCKSARSLFVVAQERNHD